MVTNVPQSLVILHLGNVKLHTKPIVHVMITMLVLKVTNVLPLDFVLVLLRIALVLKFLNVTYLCAQEDNVFLFSNKFLALMAILALLIHVTHRLNSVNPLLLHVLILDLASDLIAVQAPVNAL